MIRRLVASFGFAGAAFTTPILAAQTDPAAAAHPCDSQSGATQNVCRAGYDALSLMLPVGAIAVTGGNPVLGTAAGGRGFGDIGITIRSTFLRTVLPATSYDGVADTVPAARRLPVSAPTLDLRFGLVRKALPVGAVSADFLGSVSGIPKTATDYIRFAPDVRSLGGVALGFGYGLRIGVEPNGPLPVVSLNFGRKDLPKFTLGDLSDGSNWAYTVAVSAIDVRLMVGRRFGLFELAAGGGVDLIKGNYSIVFRDQDTGLPAARADSSMSAMRIVTTANGALVVGGARLTLEAGFQVGKDDKLPTVFQAINGRSGRFFGGLGFGFKL
ncbi:MAG: hypothetical protein R2882_05450 [Gemmatimonadales bacterium]